MTKEEKIVKYILLNGRQVKFPVDWNLEEGWVSFEIPVFQEKNLIVSGQSVNTLQDSTGNEITWEIKKEFGDIRLIYASDVD